MKPLFKYLFIILFSTALIACSSSGGDDDDDIVTPSLPQDATTITSANASAVARSAVDNLVLFGAITDFRQQGDSSPSTGDVIRLVLNQAFDRNRQIALRTETVDCDSGTITLDFEETATSASGSISFNSCNLGGATINGSFTFSSTFDDFTGAYSDNGNGSLTITAGSESVTIALDFDDFGNDFSGEFSVNYSLSITGSSVANFLLTTTNRITGVGSSITGGQILVEGAGGTRLRITITVPNTAEVEFDDGSGTFVFHSTINF